MGARLARREIHVLLEVVEAWKETKVFPTDPEIAQRLETTKENVSGAIRRLRKKGLISLKKRTFSRQIVTEVIEVRFIQLFHGACLHGAHSQGSVEIDEFFAAARLDPRLSFPSGEQPAREHFERLWRVAMEKHYAQSVGDKSRPRFTFTSQLARHALYFSGLADRHDRRRHAALTAPSRGRYRRRMDSVQLGRFQKRIGDAT